MTATDPRIARLRADVERLAGDVGDRNVWRYEQLALAERVIAGWLREAGYEPRRQEYEALGKRFANLEVEIRGTMAPEEVVVVGAHYDTSRGSPGANDNASGIAALLALARAFALEPIRRTLRFVAFTNEERPLLRTRKMGSRVYAMRCRERGEKVVGMLCLETIAYRSESPWSQRLSLFGLVAAPGELHRLRREPRVAAASARRRRVIPTADARAVRDVHSADELPGGVELGPLVILEGGLPGPDGHRHRAAAVSILPQARGHP